MLEKAFCGELLLSVKSMIICHELMNEKRKKLIVKKEKLNDIKLMAWLLLKREMRKEQLLF